MEYPVLLIIIIAAFGSLIAIQAYRLYSINREWGYGEIVVRWISPEEKRTIFYIVAAMIALIIAIFTRSEAMLSALTALLVGFGGMLSQLTFINLIGKEGIYLGRTRKGLTWDEVEKISYIQEGNQYKLEVTSRRIKAPSVSGGFLERIQREIESLEKFDEPETTAEIKTEKEEGEGIKIRVEDRLSKEQEKKRKLEEKKREKDEVKKKEDNVEHQSYTIGFTEKHQFHIQQALMYYFAKGVEYKAPSV
jgi:hypothetical protein